MADRHQQAQPETEVETARDREVAVVDADAARAADRRVVAVHDRVEPGVVGDEEQVRAGDEHAGVAREAAPAASYESVTSRRRTQLMFFSMNSSSLMFV